MSGPGENAGPGGWSGWIFWENSMISMVGPGEPGGLGKKKGLGGKNA